MIIAQAAVEFDTVANFGLWPIRSRNDGEVDLIGISEKSTEADIGYVVYKLVFSSWRDAWDGVTSSSLNAFIDSTYFEDNFYLPGGLWVHDTVSTTTFRPVCCDGLEDLAMFRKLIERDGLIGYGHEPDPEPMVKRHGQSVTFWTDATNPDSKRFTLPLSEYAELLDSVFNDVSGFGSRLSLWALRSMPESAERLVSVFMRNIGGDSAAPL